MALLTIKFATDVRDTSYEIAEFHGEMDQSVLSGAEKQISEFLAGFKRAYLIFDLSALKFINSEGVGFMVSIHMKLAKRGQKLLFCGVQPNVADIFELIGLSKLIPVFQNAAAAIEFIKNK